MNKELKQYILGLNCTIINPILTKLGSQEVCGWYCKSTSILRKDEHLRLINKFINENDLEYYVEDSEHNTHFSIYKK